MTKASWPSSGRAGSSPSSTVLSSVFEVVPEQYRIYCRLLAFVKLRGSSGCAVRTHLLCATLMQDFTFPGEMTLDKKISEMNRFMQPCPPQTSCATLHASNRCSKRVLMHSTYASLHRFPYAQQERVGTCTAPTAQDMHAAGNNSYLSGRAWIYFGQLP